MSIPSRVLLASSDLNARARVMAAAGEREVSIAGAGELLAALESAALGDRDVLIVDLDEAGEEGLAQLATARDRGLVPGEVIGFISHVDRALGEAARRAGCRTIARGRFWTHLPELLED